MKFARFCFDQYLPLYIEWKKSRMAFYSRFGKDIHGT